MAPLGPESAQIFRITHVNNIPWILDNGLHCQSSGKRDPGFIGIGMAELIGKRAGHPVHIGPGGRLSDYVPFYFTPWSIMMYNIKTGFGGVIQRPRTEIAILVSSLPRLQELGVPFVFTNGHAYAIGTDYYESMDDLGQIDWALLRARDFRRDPDDPGKLNRYQAEALAHGRVPVEALQGIACYDDAGVGGVRAELASRGLAIPVKTMPGWYF
jgi:hypothetical protein